MDKIELEMFVEHNQTKNLRKAFNHRLGEFKTKSPKGKLVIYFEDGETLESPVTFIRVSGLDIDMIPKKWRPLKEEMKNKDRL